MTNDYMSVYLPESVYPYGIRADDLTNISISQPRVMPPVSESVVDSILANNTYMPKIKRIIYNLQTEKNDPERSGGKIKLAKPVMTTTVLFEDNTSVTVQNADDDAVELETVDVDGEKVTTTSRRSKELALVHAIVKRLVCRPGQNGSCSGGYGKALGKMVDGAYDQVVEETKTRRARAARKAAFENAKKAKAEKPKRYTLDDVVQMLGPVLAAAVPGADVKKMITEKAKKAKKAKKA